jgi:hypothetical protein
MPRGPQYTDEELLEEVRRLAEEMGRAPPLKRDMNDHGKYAPRTLQLRFGSWSEAVAEAGFEPRKAAGDTYEERPSECPLCGTSGGGLDFHHWRYGDNELGCYLCRDCHDRIHSGGAGTQNPNWLVLCVKNLTREHVENHGPDSPEVIIDRYNLPDVEDLVTSNDQ